MLDLAGLVVEEELEAAGADELAGVEDALELPLEDAGALLLAGCADDLALRVEDFAGAVSVDVELDELLEAASPDAFVDFDFLLVDLAPELASADAAESVEAVLVDLDFLALVALEADAESDDSALASVEADFVDFDFFELADFVPEAVSAEAASSDDLADFDSFELVLELVDLLEDLLADFESVSEEADAVFLDLEVEDFFADDVSLESVELASVDFFLDLVVFFAEAVLESLESEAWPLAGAALTSAKASPAEITNANAYLLSRVMPIPPQ